MKCEKAPPQPTAHQRDVEKVERALGEGKIVVFAVDLASTHSAAIHVNYADVERRIAASISEVQEKQTAAMVAMQVPDESVRVSSTVLLNELNVELARLKIKRDAPTDDDIRPAELHQQMLGFMQAMGVVRGEIIRAAGAVALTEKQNSPSGRAPSGLRRPSE